MSSAKNFDTLSVLALTTGKLLKTGTFGKVHELAEWVLGHPVWLHEFAMNETWQNFRERIYEQHPQLAEFDGDLITPANVEAVSVEAVQRFGERLEILKGDADRERSPVETAREVMPDKPIICVSREVEDTEQ